MIRIFIVGCPRSGTTLVQKMLGSREDVYTCKETHFFQKIRRPGRRRVMDYLFLSQDRVQVAHDFIRDHNEHLRVYDARRVRTVGSAARLLDQIMTSEAQVRGKAVWVEKTPPHLFYIPWIERYIPDARIVHVLRDGRDVVASMVDAARKYPEAPAWTQYADVDTAIAEYNRCLDVSQQYYGHEGHAFVQYEAILDDVEMESHRLITRLGLVDARAQLDLAAVHAWVVRGDEGWKGPADGEVRETRLMKFNRVLDPAQRRTVSSGVRRLPRLNSI